MSDQSRGPESANRDKFNHRIEAIALRKQKARADLGQGVWFGLGMVGLIGWSVVVPTLLGVALGIWLDGRSHSDHSWTLALMAAGLGLGCLNAWHWVSKEDAEMHQDNETSKDLKHE